jgi:DNA-binding response OmpR family regulator
LLQILLVEDDADLAGVIAAFLERHDYRVDKAPDALDALDLIETKRFDLVITDLMLPHMDGTSFVRRLRADARFEKTPIIMVTAYSDDEVLDESLRGGVSFVLPKPIDFDRLLSLVRFSE